MQLSEQATDLLPNRGRCGGHHISPYDLPQQCDDRRESFMVELVTNLCTVIAIRASSPKRMMAGSAAGKCLSIGWSKYLKEKFE
jgi:hypothetical protein